MRRALCAAALVAAIICVPQGVRAAELPAKSVDQSLPVTTAVYRGTEQGTNVQEVDYRYRYGYRTPYYRYGYRYPSYGYGYRYPSYGYRSYYRPSYGYRYGYGYPSYGYGSRYGYRPGISFGFRF